MILLQILSLLFGLFMLYTVRIHLMKQHIQKTEFYLWIFVWLVFIFLAIFPQSTASITQSLKISRVFDLLVIIAMIILSYLTFVNRIAYKQLEKKLEKIIRKNSIDEKK